ncbi:MAG: rhamnulokinase family protein [Clostridia bacterium]
MKETKVLAFDFGASSGRAMIGIFDGEKIRYEEAHRFTNDPVFIGDTFYWDILRLFFEVKNGISSAANRYGDIKSIGFDTWGVDFGLLDENGKLLDNPVHYRDERTNGMIEKVNAEIGSDYLYNATGIQFMSFNTLYQLLALKNDRPDILSRAKTLLFTPDLLIYFLTGKKSTEYSIASTSALINPKLGSFNKELLEKLALPTDIFTNIITAGNVVGPISDSICNELSIKPINVVSVCEHDTGSAVVSIPSTEDNVLYISCGTWSLLGTELLAPNISTECMNVGFTNEGGYNKTTRFLKNIIGLWIIQESRRQWEREGESLSFKDLDLLTIKAESRKCFISPTNDMFMTPGNLPERIQNYCRDTNQEVPIGKGEIVRCITESLALEYRYTIEELEKITKIKYDTIHIIGGGVQDKILCQATANATNRKVIAGPVEATALGNIAAQLIALGEIENLKKAREIIKNSFEFDEYVPEDTELWNSSYEEFLKITNR